MARIYYKVCDKCGKEINYDGKTSKLFKRISIPIGFRLLSIFNGNQTGYDYSEKYVELCKYCSAQLDKFLNNTK